MYGYKTWATDMTMNMIHGYGYYPWIFMDISMDISTTIHGYIHGYPLCGYSSYAMPWMLAALQFIILLLMTVVASCYSTSGCSGLVVEYRTRNQEVAGSTHTRSSASNLEQVANLLCAQANSASYPYRDGKWVVATATGWRPSVADWGDGVSVSCTVGLIVR